MAIEFPVDFPSSLLKSIQKGLRKEAGISSYDPDDPSLQRIPTLEETIAEFDPSPPYLRCKQCRGRLLRGLQSTICVYCGAEQRRDVPPPSISFNMTFAYRKLLESLQVDGSETVALGNEASDSTGTENASSEGLVLSDLLDLKLRWPEDLEESGTSSDNKVPTVSQPVVNLAGVDLDNFFSDANLKTAPSVSEPQLTADEQIRNMNSHLPSSQDSVGISLNIQSSCLSLNPTDMSGGQFGESFSLWEAEFQSASSENLPGNTNSVDLFPESSAVEHATPVEAAAIDLSVDSKFEIESHGADGQLKDNPDDMLSMAHNLTKDDLWHTASAQASSNIEQLEISKDDESKSIPKHPSSVTGDWIEDDFWHTSSTTQSKSTERTTQNDDSLNVWQDFARSADAVDPFSDSWPQITTSNTLINGHASADISSGLTDNSKEMEFGSVFEPNVSSGASSIQKGSTGVNLMQLDAFPLDRMQEVKSENPVDGSTGASSATSQFAPADPNVEMLMSEMPDLSFMLGDNLSIPKRVERADSIS